MRAITEGLCGHGFSARSVSAVTEQLDEALERFMQRPVTEVLPTALWQRCYVHFPRSALDHLPRSADRACLQELRWPNDRRDATEARTDLRAWRGRWQDKHPNPLHLQHLSPAQAWLGCRRFRA